MKHLLIIFSLGFLFFAKAQTKLYLDSSQKYISSKSYFNKCKSTVVTCKYFNHNKDTVLYAMFPKYKFGKLDKKDLIFINKVFVRNHTILIKNYDSIAIISNILNTSKFSLVKKTKNEKSNIFLEIKNRKYKDSTFDLSRHFYKKYKTILNKRISKIHKFEKKYKLKLLSRVDTDLISIDNPNFLINANNLFEKEGVFDFTNQYYNILLRKDGNYFLFDIRLSIDKLKKIIKSEEWKYYQDDLDRSLNNYKIGFFNKNNNDYSYLYY